MREGADEGVAMALHRLYLPAVEAFEAAKPEFAPDGCVGNLNGYFGIVTEVIRSDEPVFDRLSGNHRMSANGVCWPGHLLVEGNGYCENDGKKPD